MKEIRFKQTEIGLLPEDWNVTTLSRVCKIFGRIGYRGYSTADIVTPENGAISISPTNIINGQMDYTKCTYISWHKYNESPEIKIYNGDILIVKTGSTYGKSALVKSLAQKATINPQIVVLKDINIDNVFLSYVCLTPQFLEQVESVIVGGAIPTLSQKKMGQFIIPQLCIKEQKKIASALTAIDNLLLSLEKLIEKKRLIKQGTMQELLTGKKRLPGFTGEWVERQVKDIGSIGRGRVISQKEIERSYQHKYPVYSSQTQNNGIMGYIDTYDFEGEYITWTTDGVNAGTVFYRNGLFNCTNVCGTIKLHKDNHLFVSMRLGLETNNYVSTNLANPKLMNNVMKQIVIDLPETVEEQKAIASVLSSMDREIESLEGKKAKYEQIKQGMMQQLLTGKIRLI